MSIERLIPFKVKVVCTNEELREWGMRQRYFLTVSIDYDAVFNKEWTVVCYEGICFLLVRPGELAQWWPRELAQVVEVPAPAKD